MNANIVVKKQWINLCNYYQIFCKETRKNLKYSPTLKEEYIDYFSLNPDIISFCGQEEYILRDMEKTDKKRNCNI